jgi:hypothetical protein
MGFFLCNASIPAVNSARTTSISSGYLYFQRSSNHQSIPHLGLYTTYLSPVDALKTYHQRNCCSTCISILPLNAITHNDGVSKVKASISGNASGCLK